MDALIEAAERKRLNQARYRERHRETLREKDRLYRLANIEQERARVREYTQRFPEKVREGKRASAKRVYDPQKAAITHRDMMAKHGDKVRASSKVWRENNAERQRERHKQWVVANPEANRLAGHRRRARIADAPGRGFFLADWRASRAEFGERCAYCAAVGVKLVVEHMDPIAAGGEHDPANIVPACHSCNSSKHHRSVLLWFAWRQATNRKAS